MRKCSITLLSDRHAYTYANIVKNATVEMVIQH